MTFQKEGKFGHIAETSTLPSCLAFKSKLGQSLSTLHLNTRANKRILGKHKQGDEFLIHTGSRIKSHFHPHRHTTKGLAKGNINFFSWITKLSPDYSITCVCYPSLFKSPPLSYCRCLVPTSEAFTTTFTPLCAFASSLAVGTTPADTGTNTPQGKKDLVDCSR